MFNVYIVVMGDGNENHLARTEKMSGVVKFNRGGFLAQRVITAFFHYKETQ